MKVKITSGLRLTTGEPMNTGSIHEFDKLPIELKGKCLEMVEEKKSAPKRKAKTKEV